METKFYEDGRNWYAVYTKPKQEDRADSNLRSWRVETFAPKIRERQLNPLTGKPRYVVRPLFPRYIFARFDANSLLQKVCYTRGVQNVVRHGDTPTTVDDEIISVIQSRAGEDGYVHVGDERPREEFRPGDRVKITDGPLENFVGLFEDNYTDDDRVAIMLTAVSYQSRVVIERESVEKMN
jgi:transcriptional antiterminator RfaH